MKQRKLRIRCEPKSDFFFFLFFTLLDELVTRDGEGEIIRSEHGVKYGECSGVLYPLVDRWIVERETQRKEPRRDRKKKVPLPENNGTDIPD
jgi:hypothetical protein